MTLTPDHQTNTGFRRLILASVSPRRRSILREHGYDVESVAPPLREPDMDQTARWTTVHTTEPSNSRPSPAAVVEAISYYKAMSVADRLDSSVVIAGDTIVSLNDRLFGKPSDRAQASDILHALQGTTHQVITGVALVDAAAGARLIGHTTTDVTMRTIPEPQLRRYLDSGAWRGKAGAFGIQDHDDPFVERITGSFTNVVGMPMELVRSMLAEWGITPSLPAAKRS